MAQLSDGRPAPAASAASAMHVLSTVTHAAVALATLAVYAAHLPFAPALTTLVPLLVGGGWVVAPYVSSFKLVPTIRRQWAAAAYLAAAAAVCAPGLWAYLRPARDGSSRVLVYMLVPLLQAIALTVAGAAAKAGERRRPLGSTGVGRARDESDQEG